MMQSDTEFWHYLDQLLVGAHIIIDRPRGSTHPRMPGVIYPLDYGYLQGTSSGDGEGIDVWIGSQPEAGVVAIACTVDLQKRDAEIKLLIGCNQHECQTITQMLSQGEMRCTLLQRPSFVP